MGVGGCIFVLYMSMEKCMYLCMYANLRGTLILTSIHSAVGFD